MQRTLFVGERPSFVTMPRKAQKPVRPRPKVWHNPSVIVPGVPKRRGAAVVQQVEAPSVAPSVEPAHGKRARVAKMAPAAGAVDAREAERDRLLGKLLGAAGRAAITSAAAAFVAGGFELPSEDQEAQLQLLEHYDEAAVLSAIACLERLLEQQAPKRFLVLESRLRRLEEFADDAQTVSAAARLRRRVLALRA